VTVDGGPADLRELEMTLDGRPFFGFRPVSIGRRTLRVTGPGLVPYSVKAWVWYGVNELGTLELQRARGRLEVAVVEGPRRFLLKGTHFELDRPDLAGFSGEVPEGLYTLAAVYPGFVVATNLTVRRDTTNRLEARAELVAVRLTSEPPGAAMRLARDDAFTVELKVEDEAVTPPLPVGTYRLSGRLPDGYETSAVVELTAGVTNEVRLVFVHGGVELVTEPAGAAVRGEGARRLGVTPLTLARVRPGEHRYRVEHPGCEPLDVSLMVVGTNVARAHHRLEPRGAAAAKKLAASPEGASAEKIKDALNDLEAAVRLRPDDTSLWLSATNLLVARALARAREQEDAGRWEPALAQAREALRLRPGLAEAEAMQTRLQAKAAAAEVEAQALRHRLLARQKEDEAKAAELRKKQEAERRRREAEQVFARGIAHMRDQNLFETHRWEFDAPKLDVLKGLGAVLTAEGNRWRLQPQRPDDPRGDMVHLRSGYSALVSPLPVRDAFLFIQALDERRTLVIAKFWQYKTTPNARMQGREYVEGLIPYHMDYVRQGAPGDANIQMARMVEEFRARLTSGIPKS
jgi:hypothetical protein